MLCRQVCGQHRQVLRHRHRHHRWHTPLRAAVRRQALSKAAAQRRRPVHSIRPRQRQIKLRAASSLGPPRPIGTCALARHTGLAFHTGFKPSELFLLGAPLTVGATVLYARAPERLLPARCSARAVEKKPKKQRKKKGEGGGEKEGEGGEGGGEGGEGGEGAAVEERGRELEECKPQGAPVTA